MEMSFPPIAAETTPRTIPMIASIPPTLGVRDGRGGNGRGSTFQPAISTSSVRVRWRRSAIVSVSWSITLSSASSGVSSPLSLCSPSFTTADEFVTNGRGVQ